MEGILSSTFGLLGKYSKLGVSLLMLLGFFGGMVMPLVNSQQCPSGCVSATTCVATNGCIPGAQGSCASGTYACGSASSSSSSSSSGATQVNSSICIIYNDIHSAIFILGLALMILGGALYAGGHILPGATKGQVQGYGMGLLLGGVIGIIIALLSPYILQLLVNTGGGAGGAQTTC